MLGDNGDDDDYTTTTMTRGCVWRARCVRCGGQKSTRNINCNFKTKIKIINIYICNKKL